MFFRKDTQERDQARSKIIYSYEELAEKIKACRVLGARVVTTIGSWDMLHIGHVRYLIEASRFGGVLVVGVDSDVTINRYKGPHRPVIPQNERLEMVSYLSCVDFVTLITDVNRAGSWQYGLLDAVRSDMFVAVEDSYPEEQQRDIRQRVGSLIVLPRQAENTSTTSIHQKVMQGALIKKGGRKNAKRKSK